MADADEMWLEWRRRLAEPAPDALAIARLATTFSQYFDKVKTEAVRAARAEGRSWEEIADAVGTSRQSAWERYHNEQVAQRRIRQLLASANDV
jgi:hypothetical protein